MNQSNQRIAQKLAESVITQDSVSYEPERSAFDTIASFIYGSLDASFDAFLENPETENYITETILSSKCLDPKMIRDNPYGKAVHFANQKIGNFRLMNIEYKAGEILQYDFPHMREDDLVLKLGYFPEDVFFPAIYEGNIPWMSLIPSEIATMKESIANTYGNVRVYGLGLGYYTIMCAMREEVHSLAVVEKSEEVITLFKSLILPCFPQKVQNKINIVSADALKDIQKIEDGTYDCIFVDIYEGYEDGSLVYQKMKPYQDAMHKTKWMYWIEEYIKS